MAKVPAAQPVTYPSMMQGLSASHGRMSNTAVGNRNKDRRAFRRWSTHPCPRWQESTLRLLQAPVIFQEIAKLARPAATSRCRSRADRFRRVYFRAAQAYMLISMPTGTSTIFGVFQLIRVSPKQCRHDCRAGTETRVTSNAAQARKTRCRRQVAYRPPETSLLDKASSLLDKASE
jgi:hypothetical protein